MSDILYMLHCKVMDDFHSTQHTKLIVQAIIVRSLLLVIISLILYKSCKTLLIVPYYNNSVLARETTGKLIIKVYYL